jgi:galactoside O-acetyltransferase
VIRWSSRRAMRILDEVSIALSTASTRAQVAQCGAGARCVGPTVIRGGENICIGARFQAMGQLFLYANDGGVLRIGDDCALNTNVQLGAAGGRLSLGSGVLIGPNVVIRVSNHGIVRGTPMRTQPHVFGEIVIEDDVWIGSNAVITSGVTLAPGTVVGAGSVVTHSTEANSIVGGVPAAKIGERR